MSDENLKKAKEIINGFFDKMTLPVVIEQQESEGEILKIKLSSSEAQVLIGQQGKTLGDIQAVLGRILRKQLGEGLLIDIDINGYKSEKEQRFCDIAQEAADEAVRTGREKTLFAMNAFERRIIHTELAKRNDVKTESIGENDDRRVVITPI